MFLSRHTTASVLALASCFILGACDTSSTTTGTSNQATVRFVNAMTGSSTLSLSSNSTAGTGVAYQAFGACQTVPTGSVNFAIGQTGSSTALVTIPATTVSAGGRYTVIATGSVSASTYLLLNDAFTTPASGRARLRVINAVGLTTPFDVYVGTPGSSLGTANQTNVAFNTSQSFLDVPSGATQVWITTPGTQTVLGTTGSFTLSRSTPQTVVVTPAVTVGGQLVTVITPNC